MSHQEDTDARPAVTIAAMRGTSRKMLSRELRWLLGRAAKLARLHTLTLILITAGSGLTLADPLIMRWIIDRAIPTRDRKALLLAAVLFCAAFIARLALTYGAVLSSTIAAQKIMFRIRIGLVRRLNVLPAKYHERSSVGDNLYRLDEDVSRIGDLGGEIIPTALRMIVMGVMVFFTMMALDLRLTLLLSPLLILFYYSQRRSQEQLRKISDSVQQQNGSVTSFLEEHLNGIVQLKLLNRTQARTRLLARTLAQVSGAQLRQRLAEMQFNFFSMAIIVLGNTLVLAYGGYQVMSANLSIGTLVAFYGYLLRLFEPLMIATDLQARGQRVAASIGRVLEILEHHSLPARDPRERLAQLRPASLEFREVSFAYRKDRPVLNNVSFVIRAGEKVALVGLNGSGKSTIGQIASGLYAPEQGRVLVNGKDAGILTPGSLRAAVTMVPQDPVIFAGTIRENLLYGDPHACEARIIEAARYAHFDEVIRRFPAGMEELLGPRGRRLSGGERKRLALARAMLQQPEILILDEVTGALDEPVAHSLLKSLDQFRNGHALMLISHRPATIQWAERILVVHQGTILDDGPHHHLMERCQIYRQILRARQPVPEI